ncbi:cytochrome P450 2W1 isoform X6 [Saccopteryx bilineata]|uniref:cytochrome P450 2W1 isoform X6 n=1 Tax=Saccopteryx bilineata TaxID=59482 RepID=UPI00338F8436
MAPLLLLGLLALLGLWVLLRARAPAPGWPPGPRPLPLIGNLHLLRVSQQERSLMELSEQYGPVFTVHMGLQKTVVLTGYEAVREALVGTGQRLADRPPIAIFQLIQGGMAWGQAGSPWPTKPCRSSGAWWTSWSSTELFNIYPRLGALLQLHQPVLRKIEEVRAILRTLLEARRPPAPGPGPVRSYVDALLQQGQGGDPDGLFGEDNVVACVLDMVMAGTETTSATLQWAALLMGRHPHVQGQVQEELDRVLGPGRPPRPEDQRSLPYTNAVLHEVQRFITLLPHMPRCTAADTRLGGYLLPKGTPVVPLLSSVLLDKTQWETPHQFNPGHFLDAQGHFVKREAFLPFSAGRRVCVGESLARMELFLLFAGLLYRFRLLPPPGLSPGGLDTRPAPAFTMRPPAQVLCAVPRPRTLACSLKTDGPSPGP